MKSGVKIPRLILLDRDGTLTFEKQEYHRDLAELRDYPFTGPTLRMLKKKGLLLAMVTNQSGVGRGYWTEEEVRETHHRFLKAWGVEMPVYMCPHLPDAHCGCRKPKSELLLQAMSDLGASPGETLMVGDSVKDFEAASAAGVSFALVLTGRGRLTQAEITTGGILVADSLAALWGWIESG